MTHPTQAPPVQATTTIPVGQVNGVYSVLQGLQPGNILMGGWGYLTWTGSVYHEALDLNSMGGGDADLGALVVAPLAGVVTFAEQWDGWQDGFGTHLALLIDDPQAAELCYVHLAHLDLLTVGVGDRVTGGQVVGTCGKSGNQVYSHVHAAWWVDVPPGGWNFWQTGYPREWVAERTLDPEDWFWASAARGGSVNMGILSAAQQEAVEAAVWGKHWDAGAAQFAIPASWREEWAAGRWRGAPAGAEQLLPEDQAAGKPGGSFQVFAGGCACWLPGEPVSWTG